MKTQRRRSTEELNDAMPAPSPARVMVQTLIDSLNPNDIPATIERAERELLTATSPSQRLVLGLTRDLGREALEATR